MKNIALFLNHQTNHQKNKLPSLGFECFFLYLDSGARNLFGLLIKIVYNLVVIFEAEIQIMGGKITENLGFESPLQ